MPRPARSHTASVGLSQSRHVRAVVRGTSRPHTSPSRGWDGSAPRVPAIAGCRCSTACCAELRHEVPGLRSCVDAPARTVSSRGPCLNRLDGWPPTHARRGGSRSGGCFLARAGAARRGLRSAAASVAAPATPPPGKRGGTAARPAARRLTGLPAAAPCLRGPRPQRVRWPWPAPSRSAPRQAASHRCPGGRRETARSAVPGDADQPPPGGRSNR
jgi:hypothetical protein